MENYIISESVSFFICFLIGIGISLQPGAVVAGVHISQPLRSNGKRWLAFVIMSVIVLLCDMAVMHFLELFYISVYSITEYLAMLQNPVVSTGIFFVLALSILDLAGVVDMFHGERNLMFRYEQIKQELVAPSWDERYVQSHSQSVLACFLSFIYMLRVPLRSSWPYVVWALSCKSVRILLDLALVYLVPKWDALTLLLGATDSDAPALMSSFIFTYLIMGYLCGHLIFHYDESKLRTDGVLIGRIVVNIAVILSIIGLIFGFSLFFYF
ncbi:hypothetical protein [Veillonella caviae]|uniref:hypothetical protein n=1 Tax=Veillonella caviae TaxID=248316 RepID=UPI0023A82F4A|nr:hypothetical protein [Veillonella caviae]MCI5707953.1 hypothetical protein [Veillonella caviae]